MIQLLLLSPGCTLADTTTPGREAITSGDAGENKEMIGNTQFIVLC